MHSITCTIITLNEEHCIGGTIDAALQVADTIIVVDSGSTDRTIEIARSKGVDVIHNDWIGYGPQKRFAADHAKTDWILNLDADEVLSSKLIEQINQWKREGKENPKGFRLKIVSVYAGRKNPRFLAEYHDYVRLYDKRAMRFRNSLTHDEVVSGSEPLGRFSANCLHYSHKSLEHIAMKLERYTDLQAKEIKKPLWQLYLRRPFEYPILFIRYYFIRGHIFGGIYGLKVAHIISKIRASRIRKFIQAHRDNQA